MAAVLAGAVPAVGQDLRPETVERVRPAAVLLRAVWPDGTAVQARGFLTVEADVVITSAHALGVGWAADPLPTSVTAVLDAGLPTERSLPATQRAVDRDLDLAVLGVTGANRPPLPAGWAARLAQGRKLATVGFPTGPGVGILVGPGNAHQPPGYQWMSLRACHTAATPCS